MKVFCLAFTLNTGEILTTCEVDMNAYFGMKDFPRRNQKIRRELRMFEKDYHNKTYPAVLAKLMFQNARRIGMDVDPLAESESVVSAVFGHYCHCFRMEGGRQGGEGIESVV